MKQVLKQPGTFLERIGVSRLSNILSFKRTNGICLE